MKSILAALLLIVSAGLASAASSRPNVLYIFTDDQSVRTVGCYPDAYPWVRTPNIDAVAAKGVRFQNVYMAAYCVPSRVSFLTGNLPHAA
ncbi:MAG: sulfatase-like hydrolase/transferase, partial [Verrucomicrobium sp.]|nr:sulfatase-like hydrolase/transferase [Verrucomicrobium sp.]